MGLLEYILIQAISIYTILIVVYILMSWFPGARQSSIGEMIGKLCEPFLAQFRRIIPPLGMIDISPIIALIVLKFASTGIMEIFRFLR